MKKIYVKPQLVSVKINSVSLLTLSGDGVSVQMTNEGATSEGESRSFSFGDEE